MQRTVIETERGFELNPPLKGKEIEYLVMIPLPLRPALNRSGLGEDARLHPLSERQFAEEIADFANKELGNQIHNQS